MPVSSEKGKNIIVDWFDKQTDISIIVDLFYDRIWNKLVK